MPRAGASPSPRPSPFPSPSRTPAYPETPGARGLTWRRRPRARARGRPLILVGSFGPAKPALQRVRKRAAGGSGWWGVRGPAGRRAEAARCPGCGPAAGRRAKAGLLCEGWRRRRRMGSTLRGRVSGERRPAPRSASSRRTGRQLGWWTPGLLGVGLVRPRGERAARDEWRAFS